MDIRNGTDGYEKDSGQNEETEMSSLRCDHRAIRKR